MNGCLLRSECSQGSEMVNKTAIARNLRQLESRYNRKPRSQLDPLYYSKLALIELCGWVEVTMDEIVRDCARKHLTGSQNLLYVENTIIRGTHSFGYAQDFRTMLMRVIGLVKVEQLEGMLDPTKFQLMKSSLGILRKQRNREAHNYISGITPTVDAPSVIANRHFPRVYEGLKDIERCIRRLKM